MFRYLEGWGGGWREGNILITMSLGEVRPSHCCKARMDANTHLKPYVCDNSLVLKINPGKKETSITPRWVFSRVFSSFTAVAELNCTVWWFQWLRERWVVKLTKMLRLSSGYWLSMEEWPYQWNWLILLASGVLSSKPFSFLINFINMA